jgi:hypothetical protein
MEFHGRSWKSQGKENVYIYYLVANQASRFLASDFRVLVCFVLSSLLQVYQQAGILENSANIYLILSSLYFSTSFWLLAHHHLPLRPSQGEFFGHIFPKQSGDPLTRNWTRQPEVYCLLYPKHITVTTTCDVPPNSKINT